MPRGGRGRAGCSRPPCCTERALVPRGLDVTTSTARRPQASRQVLVRARFATTRPDVSLVEQATALYHAGDRAGYARVRDEARARSRTTRRSPASCPCSRGQSPSPTRTSRPPYASTLAAREDALAARSPTTYVGAAVALAEPSATCRPPGRGLRGPRGRVGDPRRPGRARGRRVDLRAASRSCACAGDAGFAAAKDAYEQRRRDEAARTTGPAQGSADSERELLLRHRGRPRPARPRAPDRRARTAGPSGAGWWTRSAPCRCRGRSGGTTAASLSSVAPAKTSRSRSMQTEASPACTACATRAGSQPCWRTSYSPMRCDDRGRLTRVDHGVPDCSWMWPQPQGRVGAAEQLTTRPSERTTAALGCLPHRWGAHGRSARPISVISSHAVCAAARPVMPAWS